MMPVTISEIDNAMIVSDAPADEPLQMGELAKLIASYNEVMDRLQQSHEVLGAEVVRLQNELASTDAQLQRSKRLAALGEMAAGIAHEIRNPLAAIQLYATLMRGELEEHIEHERGAMKSIGANSVTLAASSDYAVKIASAVRGLDAIVNDVLSFAREMKLNRSQLVVGDVIGRAIESQRPAIEAGSVRVVLGNKDEAADGAKALAVEADRELLHRAIVNLIRNAVEAMAPGGGTLWLGGRWQDDQVVINVRDTGPGIADRDVDRIFNPFFTTRGTGTGLGLAIVHRIVDAHGGGICVSNDGGAVFELSLPQVDRPRRDVSPQDHTATDVTAAGSNRGARPVMAGAIE